MKKTILFAVMTALFAFVGTARAAQSDNTVVITFDGSSATVSIAANIRKYITDASEGSSHVKLTQSEAVDATVGEITYILSGSSTDGEFYLEGNYKATVELNGLTLTNPAGPAINIQDGKRIKVSLKNGTENTLTDGANDTYNGCLHCKGHTEFKGKGTLNVTGNAKHAIYSKEYVQIKNCTINVTAAAKDGIHCKEYFLMESGTVNITGATDDGIQVELDTSIESTGVTADHEDENSGNFYLLDGTLTINGYEGKAIKADGSVTYTGGTRNFDTADVTENAAAGIYGVTIGTDNGATQVYSLGGRRLADSVATEKGIHIIKKTNHTTKQISK